MIKKKNLQTLSLCAFVMGAGLAFDASKNSANATCVPEPYIGSVCITAATFCPREYAELVGQTMSITDNSALYSLVGNLYGGDGRTTFALPDLRGRSVVNRNPQQLPDGRSFFGTGQVRGNEEVVMDVTQLPSHSHSAIFTPLPQGAASDVQVSTNNGTKDTPEDGDFMAISADGLKKIKKYLPSGSEGTTVSLGGVTGGGSSGGTVIVGNTGANQPVPTMPPQIALKFCIALSGLYPPRD